MGLHLKLINKSEQRLSNVLVSSEELNHNRLAHIVPFVKHIVADERGCQLLKLNKDFPQRWLLYCWSFLQILKSREYVRYDFAEFV